MLTATQSSDVVEQLDDVAALVGQTPLHHIRRAYHKSGVSILAKLEWYQLGQSIKARPAFEIIKTAILNEQLGRGQRLLDATTGNTGIGYAAICARMGLPLTLCLPEDTPSAHLRTLRSFGAELRFSPAKDGIVGARAMARQLVEEYPQAYFYADQYDNADTWKAHYYGTAREIYHQTQGQVTHFITGLGSTGTLMGTGQKLKEVNAAIQIVALHPEGDRQHLPGWYQWPQGQMPGIYRPELVHAHLTVSAQETRHWRQRIAQEEGMLVSPSAAANLAGAVKLADTLEEGVIVTVFADDASRYFSDHWTVINQAV